MQAIDVVDSHTGGEPTRVVVGGFPALGHGGVAAQRERFRNEHDAFRRAIVGEPRGADGMVGALLLPPQHAGSCAGVIFFNSAGYPASCGHAVIGALRTLAPRPHPQRLPSHRHAERHGRGRTA